MKLNLSSRLKTTAVVLAWVGALFVSESKAAEGYHDENGVYRVDVQDLEPIYDQTKDTNSLYIGNLIYNPKEKRILSLDGGGLRGIYSALELSVLEEIMNHPLNEELKREILKKIAQDDPKDFSIRCKKYPHENSRPLYIRDFFHCAAGTSTGSIIAAGLCSKKNYSAIDIARIYVRYGYKIFDQHKQGQGMVAAKYCNTGLTELLAIHFGDDTIDQHVHKPLYILAQNERDRSHIVFSTLPDKRIQNGLETNVSLLNAVLSSSSAPTYFPAHTFMFNRKKIQTSDGGTWQNNPSFQAFVRYACHVSEGHFGIYSFGTGTIPLDPGSMRTANAGGLNCAAHLCSQVMESQIKGVVDSCILTTQDPASRLKFFVRINPQLDEGKGEMDDTSPEYIRYGIHKAFSMTRSHSFKIMCEKLGLLVPDESDLIKIHNDILNKIDQLESDDYEQISPLEKEYLLKKVLEQDFVFFERAKLGFRDPSKVEKFISDLTAACAAKAEKDSYWTQAYGYFIGDTASNAKEYLQRGIAFHNLSNDLTKVAPISLEMLDALKGFTNVGSTYNTYNHGKNPDEDSRVIFLKNIYEMFKACADDPIHGQFSEREGYIVGSKKTLINSVNQETKGAYGTHDSPFMDFICAIFWKDVLRNIEQTVTKDQLMNLKNSLYYIKDTEMYNRSRFGVVFLANRIYSTRLTPLIAALEQYIEKKFSVKK